MNDWAGVIKTFLEGTKEESDESILLLADLFEELGDTDQTNRLRQGCHLYAMTNLEQFKQTLEKIDSNWTPD